MNDRRAGLVWNAEPTIFRVPNPPPRVFPQRQVVVRDSAPVPSPYLQKKHEDNVGKTLSYLERCKAEIRQKRAERYLHSRSETALKFKRSVQAKNRAISRLQKRLSDSETRARTKTEVLDAVRDKLSSDMCELLDTQLSNSLVKKNCYTDSFKQLALSICFKSTACYNFLSKRLKLPPKRTLNRWLSHLSFHEGFDDALFKLLEKRGLTMKSEDRLVSLMADEISLKELVCYDRSEDKVYGVKRNSSGTYEYPCSALVLMAAGVRKKWRQALAYFFHPTAVPGTEAKSYLLECTSRLKSAGFIVVNNTSDQGSNFNAVVTLLGVTPERPFYFYEGLKIHVTPDPPHIFKSSRNSLKGYNILTLDGLASWTHLRVFYALEKASMVRSAPKITDAHLDPPPIYGKMKVSYATQILSHSVASGIETYVALGKMPKEALATSKYCQRMNDLFDILNSSQVRSPCPYKCALTVNSNATFKFIDESIEWLKSMQIIGKDGNNITNKFLWPKGLLRKKSGISSQ